MVSLLCTQLVPYFIISVHIAIEILKRESHYGIVDIPQELLIYSSQLELKEIIGQGK